MSMVPFSHRLHSICDISDLRLRASPAALQKLDYEKKRLSMVKRGSVGGGSVDQKPTLEVARRRRQSVAFPADPGEAWGNAPRRESIARPKSKQQFADMYNHR